MFFLLETRVSATALCDSPYLHKKKIYIYTQVSWFVILIVWQINLKYLYIHGIAIVCCEISNTYNVLRLCVKLCRLAKFVEKWREKGVVLLRSISAELARVWPPVPPPLSLSSSRYPAFIPLFAFVHPFSTDVITKSRSFILCFSVPPAFLEHPA